MSTREGLTEKERKCFYKAIKTIDSGEEYVICDSDSDTLTYTNSIDIRERVTGRPTDEELTRALIVVQLIKNYGYDAKNLILEDSVDYSGRTITNVAFQNDIAILDDDKNYKSLIEVKRITDYIGVNDPLINNQLFHPFEQFSKYSSVKELYYVSCDIPLNADYFPLMCVGIDTTKIKTYAEWCDKGKPSYYVDILSKDTNEPAIVNLIKVPTGDKENKKTKT